MTDIIKELKEALEFYADTDYSIRIIAEKVAGIVEGAAFQDCGKTAKAALAKLEAWEQTKLPELPEKRYEFEIETGVTCSTLYSQNEFNQLITCMEAVYKQLEKKI
jgi:predicted DNA-binding protein YlxM (UPF0122 family)